MGTAPQTATNVISYDFSLCGFVRDTVDTSARPTPQPQKSKTDPWDLHRRSIARIDIQVPKNSRPSTVPGAMSKAVLWIKMIAA